MRGLPVFRVAPDRAGRIRASDIAAGYAMALVCVPALAWGLHQAIVAAAGFEVLQYPDRPLRGGPAGFLGALMFSPALAWLAALASLPLVGATRRRRLVGWAVAALSGLALFALAALALLMSPANFDLIADGANRPLLGAWTRSLPAALLLALAFWLTVRLRRPEAFRPDLP
ncbi:MAG TPA: hypothetical protein VFR34_03580 [Paracoccaceae bacterium]|nr:hypothetical protein [Paracoccaceae bacterium]